MKVSESGYYLLCSNCGHVLNDNGILSFPYDNYCRCCRKKLIISINNDMKNYFEKYVKNLRRN